MDEVARLQLPQWLPLSDAQDMLMKTLQVCPCAYVYACAFVFVCVCADALAGLPNSLLL
jgi:hypothetical protein